MTVRKNFHFDDTVAKHLEEIAKEEGKTQTQVTQEAIEERYKKISIKNKLAILDKLAGSLTGKIGDIDAKEARRTHVLEKYGK
jgi:predicted transcriptional regulator